MLRTYIPSQLSGLPMVPPLSAVLWLEVGMTGPVILGRAGRTPLPTIRFPSAAPFERHSRLG